MPSKRTLLITGGAGFIGTAITAAALKAGWQVRIFDSLRNDVHGASGFNPDPQVEFIGGDITNYSSVQRALVGVDAVSHQAAKVGLGVNFSDAPDYVYTNDYGTATLLAAMEEVKVKHLILASSMVIYGEGAYTDKGRLVSIPPRRVEDLDKGIFDPISLTNGNPLIPSDITEDALPDPRNVYAATKLQQEYLSRAWARSTGGRVAILRYHNVYGPYMPQNTPYAGVASLFRSQLERGEAPRVFEDGGQRRDFVHVKDVANANISALKWTQDQESGVTREFNVGSGQMHTILQMAKALSRAKNGPEPVVTGEYRLGDVRHITASSKRLHEELKVPLPIKFEDSMKEFANAPLRAAVQPSP